MRMTGNQDVIYPNLLPVLNDDALEAGSDELEWIQFLINSNKVDVLKAIAANPDTDAHTLATLAHNPFPDVRAQVADNPHTPFATMMILARDIDADVRARLAASTVVPSVV